MELEIVTKYDKFRPKVSWDFLTSSQETSASRCKTVKFFKSRIFLQNLRLNTLLRLSVFSRPGVLFVKVDC